MIRACRCLLAGLAALLLACGGGGGASTAASPPAPVVSRFATASATIPQGGSAILSWAIDGAATVTLMPGIGTVTGTSITVSPRATTTYTLTASSAGGQATAQVTVTVTAAPPANLLYVDMLCTKGVPLMDEPYYSGGDPTHYSVSPSLPPGFDLDPDYGYLTALPTAVTPADTYTVTASNTAGSTSTTLTIAVNDVAPSFSYGSGTFSFTTGSAAGCSPTSTGGAVVAWSITPTLPAGLAFGTSDGSIQGTPSAISGATTYTITGTNTGGSLSVDIQLRTVPPAPTLPSAPADASANVGATATFSVTASGTGTLGYQWSRNGTDIAGATGTSYTTPVLRLTDTGAAYRVKVTDPYGGSVTSPAATLTVTSDLSAWLSAHPGVAGAIRWQFQPATGALGAYQPPADSDTVDWAHWSLSQQGDLEAAYQATRAWFTQGMPAVAMDPNGLTDTPANLHPNASQDSVTAMEWLDAGYLWRLYTGHVALVLFQEIDQPLPWHLVDDTPETLRWLLDSRTMGWLIYSQTFKTGTYAAHVPALRADNLPQTAFAPPLWTYRWLKQAGLLGITRTETIGNVLQWMRLNMVHFYGTDTFGNMDAVWQYRGFPPLSRIVAGTVDARYPADGVQHWTAGCHGSVGFLNEVLRVVNIPVQPVWVSGHELACFVSERKYLDHGDDPYNAVVRGLPGVPILDLLIDEPTYQGRFSPDLAINVDTPVATPPPPDPSYIGYAAAHFQ